MQADVIPIVAALGNITETEASQAFKNAWDMARQRTAYSDTSTYARAVLILQRTLSIPNSDLTAGWVAKEQIDTIPPSAWSTPMTN